MTTTRWMAVDDGADVETRIEELEALLKKTQKAVQQARMGYKRKSKAQPPAADAEDGEEVDPARLAKAAKAANARRVRLSAGSSTAVNILQQRSSTSSSSSAPSQCEQLCVFTERCSKSAFSA